MKLMNYFGELKKGKMIYILPLTVILLFLDFYFNLFNVVPKDWFVYHQLDAESYILGRMARSERFGIFSDAGLSGLLSPDEKPRTYDDGPFDFQYQAYLNRLPFGAYSTYDSHAGGQGIIFSILDKITPLSQAGKLHFFRMITAFFSALFLSVILLWFYLEFGYIVYFTVFASVFFSQWLVVFGRNLWWCMGFLFLPLTVVLYYLKGKKDIAKIKPLSFALAVFAGVFIKCLINGFELITTVLVMMTVPVVYYGILNKIRLKDYMKLFLAAAGSSIIAMLVVFIIICSQVSVVKGSFRKGVDHIIYSFQKRTYADPSKFSQTDSQSLEAGVTDVVMLYVTGSFFDMNYLLNTSNKFIANFIFMVRYIYLIAVFLLFSFLLLFRKKDYDPVGEEQRRALVISAWFSILAPLSWFVIFKAHSFKHMHMDFIVWQMPFTIYGFAVIGAVIRNGLSDLRNLIGQKKEREKSTGKNIKFTKGKIF